MNIYSINPQAVLFHKKFDKLNSFSIYVFNPKKNTIRKINLSAYKILRYMDSTRGITEEKYLEFCKKLGIVKQGALDFLKDMVNENVILNNAKPGA